MVFWERKSSKLCGYEWVNTLTLSPPATNANRHQQDLAEMEQDELLCGMRPDCENVKPAGYVYIAEQTLLCPQGDESVQV